MNKLNEPNLLTNLRTAGAAGGLHIRVLSAREVRRAEARRAAKKSTKKKGGSK